MIALSTVYRHCDKCKQEYPSTGMEQDTISGWMIYTCPECHIKLRMLVFNFIKGTFSENIKSTEEDFHAHGPDISKEEQKKMTAARLEVFEIMKDGQWRTVDAIIDRMHHNTTPQSVTIYLRSFREKRYGGWTVNRRKNQYGINEYQLSPC